MMGPFSSFADLRAVLAGLPLADAAAVARARARDAVLTKPAGALGRLEEVAFWLAGWKGVSADRVQVAIFAGNHGVVAQGVSAFPAEVTVQMVANFRSGGAAVNQLAKVVGASMVVEALALERPTGDFTVEAAMSEAEAVVAMRVGWESVDPQADLVVPGEMGIGNTTSAAAIACALFGGAAADWVGRGTGVDDAGLARKASAVAAVLHRSVPGALDHCIAGHVSAEAGHGRLLGALGKEPLLSLGLRLGEGSGATLAVSVIKAAAACHVGMATFGEAGVSDG
ncbi:MAG: nicotinate-nucleotide--dimethylbenzimidazole phosphoribosyltransferase [Paracoccaceae bacterium]